MSEIMIGFPTEAQKAIMKDASGRIATGILTLYNRNGLKISDWTTDSGGALASNKFLTGTDTYTPTFYYGIVERKTIPKKSDSYDGMGSWAYLPAYNPRGRSGIWIHRDYNQTTKPGTHGCIAITNPPLAQGFDDCLKGFGKNQQPDWDNTITGAAKPPTYLHSPKK